MIDVCLQYATKSDNSVPNFKNMVSVCTKYCT